MEQAAAAAGLRDDVEARKIATLLSRGCTHVCSFAPAAAPRVGQLNIAPLREAVRTVTACGKYGCSAARGTYGCREAVSISRCRGRQVRRRCTRRAPLRRLARRRRWKASRSWRRTGRHRIADCMMRCMVQGMVHCLVHCRVHGMLHGIVRRNLVARVVPRVCRDIPWGGRRTTAGASDRHSGGCGTRSDEGHAAAAATDG